MIAEIEKDHPPLEDKVDIKPGVAEAIVDKYGIEMARHRFRIGSASAFQKGPRVESYIRIAQASARRFHTVSARLLRNPRKRHGAKILYVAGGFSRQRNTNSEWFIRNSYHALQMDPGTGTEAG
ncbi:hypothetical protein [Rhodoblastus sp.]|uniref:hypothetical protein n=1 Tax=Rhodoblastus sp. TaxID=1962975 RepID=UPI003F9602A2